MEAMPFRGRVADVTGGGSGIGRLAAQRGRPNGRVTYSIGQGG
jgi:NAD(P)-dependent dehydrogenase (short-subunit alcohol dehydrogenase family)